MNTLRPLTTRTSAALLALALLAGCGTGAEDGAADEAPAASPSPSATTEPPVESTEPASPTPAPEPKGVVVEMSFQGDQITPNGERILAEVGEPILLRIESDRAGELHVHSTPEQEVAFGRGSSEHELVVDQPGVVEVEEHESGRVLVQLQVS